MANGNTPVDVPGPVAHLKALAETFRRYDTDWSHLRYQELGGDIINVSALPESLIHATEDLYIHGRDLAKLLADVFANATNPDRFVRVIDFSRYVDQQIFPQLSELEDILQKCRAELSALPAEIDEEAESAFRERQALRHRLLRRALDAGIVDNEAPAGERSLSHLKSTIGAMIGLFRRQLDLLRSAEDDVAALKLAQRPSDEGRIIDQPAIEYAFYQEGPSWVITFKSRTAMIGDLRGLHDYAYLLARPNDVVDALDLILSTAKHDPDASRRRTAAPHEMKPTRMNEKFNRTLDKRTLDNLRVRIADINAELADAEQANDDARVGRLREEREELEEFVLSKRERFQNDKKKAQSAVYKRMMTALQQIRERLPELAEYLDRHVDTGLTCQYKDDRVNWTLNRPHRTPPATRS